MTITVSQFELAIDRQWLNFQLEKAPDGGWLFLCNEWINISSILTELAGGVVAWECKDYADGWIRFATLADALEYQEESGCIMRPVRAAQADFNARIQSCLTSPAAEPVAWRWTESDGDTGGVTDREDIAEYAKVQGCDVTPLYTHPAPSASREVTVTDEMVERAAKALVVAKGTNPLCLFEFNVFTGQEPFDHEDATGRRFIYAWRKQVDNARAALLAALPEREAE